MAPPRPEPRDQRLPPILRSPHPASMPGCSKGPRGLSVLLRVDGIFTATSISPSLRSRQRPSRYAVHARRNLPDKELRSDSLLHPLVARVAIDATHLYVTSKDVKRDQYKTNALKRWAG